VDKKAHVTKAERKRSQLLFLECAEERLRGFSSVGARENIMFGVEREWTKGDPMGRYMCLL
jgi:hypothetical protein